MLPWTGFVCLAVMTLKPDGVVSSVSNPVKKISDDPLIYSLEVPSATDRFESSISRPRNRRHLETIPTGVRQRRCHRQLQSSIRLPSVLDENSSTEVGTTKRDTNSTYGNRHQSTNPTIDASKNVNAFREYLNLINLAGNDEYNALQNKFKEKLRKTKQPWRENHISAEEKPFTYPGAHAWNNPVPTYDEPKWNNPYEAEISHPAKIFSETPMTHANDEQNSQQDSIDTNLSGLENIETPIETPGESQHRPPPADHQNRADLNLDETLATQILSAIIAPSDIEPPAENPPANLKTNQNKTEEVGLPEIVTTEPEVHRQQTIDLSNKNGNPNDDKNDLDELVANILRMEMKTHGNDPDAEKNILDAVEDDLQAVLEKEKVKEPVEKPADPPQVANATVIQNNEGNATTTTTTTEEPTSEIIKETKTNKQTEVPPVEELQPEKQSETLKITEPERKPVQQIGRTQRLPALKIGPKPYQQIRPKIGPQPLQQTLSHSQEDPETLNQQDMRPRHEPRNFMNNQPGTHKRYENFNKKFKTLETSKIAQTRSNPTTGYEIYNLPGSTTRNPLEDPTDVTQPFQVIMLKENARQKADRKLIKRPALSFYKKSMKTEEPYQIVEFTTEPAATESPEKRLIQLLTSSADPKLVDEIIRDVMEFKKFLDGDHLSTTTERLSTRNPKHDKIIIPFDQKKKQIIILDPNELSTRQIQFVEKGKESATTVSPNLYELLENDELAKSAAETESTEEDEEYEEVESVKNIPRKWENPWTRNVQNRTNHEQSAIKQKSDKENRQKVEENYKKFLKDRIDYIKSLGESLRKPGMLKTQKPPKKADQNNLEHFRKYFTRTRKTSRETPSEKYEEAEGTFVNAPEKRSCNCGGQSGESEEGGLTDTAPKPACKCAKKVGKDEGSVGKKQKSKQLPCPCGKTSVTSAESWSNSQSVERDESRQVKKSSRIKNPGDPCSCGRFHDDDDEECEHRGALRSPRSHSETNKYNILNNMILWLKRFGGNKLV